MFIKRRAKDRGQTRLDWLSSYHSFSFGEYRDPRHIGISNLRVINDDTVAAGRGFDSHGHRNMEILSYVIAGALEHRDSLGNGSVIRPGDVQRMSAGSGVTHSEYNHSSVEPVHFLQIWLQPNVKNVEPGYQQRNFPLQHRRGRLVLLVSPDGREGSITSHQDGLLYGSLLTTGDRLGHMLETERCAYVHVARGSLQVNGELLSSGDGAAMKDVQKVELVGLDSEPAEILLFDLPRPPSYRSTVNR